jgi:hypothetical protein
MRRQFALSATLSMLRAKKNCMTHGSRSSRGDDQKDYRRRQKGEHSAKRLQDAALAQISPQVTLFVRAGACAELDRARELLGLKEA